MARPHFHHHPDGRIRIYTESAAYHATLDEFALDYGDRVPALPAGFRERYYESGVTHRVRGDYVYAGPPLPLAWPEGEAILAAIPSLLSAQAQREAEEAKPKTLEDARTRKIAELREALEQALVELPWREADVKTETIAALAAGASPPQEWSDWKAARDVLLERYRTAAAQADAAQSFEELEGVRFP